MSYFKKMEMKKWLLAPVLCLLALSAAWAQMDDEYLDASPENSRVRAQRVAYITARMDLTPAESEKFWALEGELEQEKRRITEQYRPERPAGEPTDAQAERMIELNFQRQEALLNLQRKYFGKFKQVVAPRKLVLYVRANREFKRDLLDALKRRQGGGR
jgi:hypothetical protein